MSDCADQVSFSYLFILKAFLVSWSRKQEKMDSLREQIYALNLLTYYKCGKK